MKIMMSPNTHRYALFMLWMTTMSLQAIWKFIAAKGNPTLMDQVASGHCKMPIDHIENDDKSGRKHYNKYAIK